MFDFTLILLLIINGLISVSLFVSALIYYLKEKHHFQENKKTSLFCSGLICIGGILNALMMRYVVQFPEVGGYNLNSNFYLITNLTSALLSFFTYYLYLRTGQGLALSSGLPGSILLSQGRVSKSISWKTVLLPIPLLIAWTFIWFAIASPEPTDLALASTPEEQPYELYLYFFHSVNTGTCYRGDTVPALCNGASCQMVWKQQSGCGAEYMGKLIGICNSSCRCCDR